MSPKIVGTAPSVADDLVALENRVLGIDHAVVIDVARQDVEPAA